MEYFEIEEIKVSRSDAGYTEMINKFSIAFATDFCKPDGSIDWEKLVAFNSSATPPKISRTKKAK
jgi:hypothetical protein